MDNHHSPDISGRKELSASKSSQKFQNKVDVKVQNIWNVWAVRIPSIHKLDIQLTQIDNRCHGKGHIGL